jgi:hypothetical protein
MGAPYLNGPFAYRNCVCAVLDSPVLHFDCASLAPELAESTGLATARLGSLLAQMVEVIDMLLRAARTGTAAI